MTAAEQHPEAVAAGGVVGESDTGSGTVASPETPVVEGNGGHLVPEAAVGSVPIQDVVADEPRLPPVSALPAPVRRLVLAWSAAALDELPAAQRPAALHRVALFHPGKRARAGALALGDVLDTVPSFRTAVAQFVTRRGATGRQPVDQAEAAGADAEEPIADPADRAARAFLLRSPTAVEDLRAVGAVRRSQPADPGLARKIRVLEKSLAALTAERDVLARSAAGTDESERLRQRLREQGVRLRAAETAAERSVAELEAARNATAAALAELRAARADGEARIQAAVERAERAERSLGLVRSAGRQRRADSDRRLELLLATLEGAAVGLRREWDLAGGGSDPADVLATGLGTARPPTESTADPARLLAWLGLPSAHLIIDGYNVTKTGYPDLTLARQRERLVAATAALSARTGADVTVVFDGAAVTVPQPAGRRVRVLFSPPGVIADDVVRDLAGAEPDGRVVVVVSSDREVATGAAERGARTAGSGVLLELLR